VTVAMDKRKNCIIFPTFLDIQCPSKAQELASEAHKVCHLSRSFEVEPQIFGSNLEPTENDENLF